MLSKQFGLYPPPSRAEILLYNIYIAIYTGIYTYYRRYPNLVTLSRIFQQFLHVHEFLALVMKYPET